MAKKKDIKDNLENIREECDEIEEVVDAKEAHTYGDPIVEFH